MTKEDILSYLKEHKEDMKKKYSVKKIALFGSYARDEQTENSDIDISVEVDKVDPFAFVHLKEELTDGLNKSIDLIRFRKNMNPYLYKQILQDAIYV